MWCASGSNLTSETVRIGNVNQIIRARKRQWRTMAVDGLAGVSVARVAWATWRMP